MYEDIISKIEIDGVPYFAIIVDSFNKSELVRANTIAKLNGYNPLTEKKHEDSGQRYIIYTKEISEWEIQRHRANLSKALYNQHTETKKILEKIYFNYCDQYPELIRIEYDSLLENIINLESIENWNATDCNCPVRDKIYKDIILPVFKSKSGSMAIDEIDVIMNTIQAENVRQN